MPTGIKTHTAATEQERQQLLSAAAALRTAAPYLNAEQRKRVCQAANNCIERRPHRLNTKPKIHKEATAHVYLRHQEKPLWR